MLKGDIIKGYEILRDFSTAGGGLSKWSFAKKNGKEYFMKEFLYPKYPTKNAPGSTKSKAKKRVRCAEFEKHHKTLMKQINEKCGSGGNLVFTVDFFRNESKYYKVTEKVDVASLSIPEIAVLPLHSRVLIMKTITHSLNVLHKADIVHGDLKPDNVLIKQTKTNNYTAKLIDFDNSYFSSHPPEMSEDLVGDMVFYSPELALYIKGSEAIQAAELTTQSDIFALGLLFCLYLTGSLPKFDQEKYGYACMAVQAGDKLRLEDPSLPPELSGLLQEMLEQDYQKRPNVSVVFDRLKALNLKAYLSEEELALKPARPLIKSTLKTLQNQPEENPEKTEKKAPTSKKKSKEMLTSSKLKGKGLKIGKDEEGEA